MQVCLANTVSILLFPRKECENKLEDQAETYECQKCPKHCPALANPFFVRSSALRITSDGKEEILL